MIFAPWARASSVRARPVVLNGIAQQEGKIDNVGSIITVKEADEEWVLRTYEKCLTIAGGGSADVVLIHIPLAT